MQQFNLQQPQNILIRDGVALYLTDFVDIQFEEADAYSYGIHHPMVYRPKISLVHREQEQGTTTPTFYKIDIGSYCVHAECKLILDPTYDIPITIEAELLVDDDGWITDKSIARAVRHDKSSIQFAPGEIGNPLTRIFTFSIRDIQSQDLTSLNDLLAQRDEEIRLLMKKVKI